MTTWGRLDGREVLHCEIRNAAGLRAQLISYGARLVAMHVPDRDGRFADVVLGFDDLARYLDTNTYAGAICGRYGNRIRRASFVLDGVRHQLSANEPPNHLHGGFRGFDRALWHAEPDHAGNAVRFSHRSPDGDEGYPGTVDVAVTYALTDENELVVRMTGVTDRPTVLNLVQHAYWNLGGHDSGDVRGHVVQLHADRYTPVDGELLPTGALAPVAGTPFDFRRPRRLGESIDRLAHTGIRATGYDHNWVLNDGAGPLRPCACILEPASGRGLELATSELGVQVYTGGYLGNTVIGKGNRPYGRYAGFTLETQKFPDSPNIPHFPSARLDPGQVYDHVMRFRFFAV